MLLGCDLLLTLFIIHSQNIPFMYGCTFSLSFSGKAEAEKSVVKEFGDKSLIIKPAIIAGGTPGEIRPPGPPGVKPVDVEAVAKLAVAGALGDLKGMIDGNDDISAAAS